MQQKLFGVLLLSWTIQVSLGQYSNLRRCYQCRSRGVKGDCRDTFIRPTPPPLDLDPDLPAPYQPDVSEPNCATGWCAKVIEGVNGDSVISEDYSVATERYCMPRAPSDGKERCAYVVFGGKQVFMCFCKGDLCNTGTSVTSSMVTIFSLVISSLIIFNYL